MIDSLSGRQRVVVAAFLHDRGEVLLAKRAATKTIAPGRYHLPGGHVEFGEHPAEALVRELREELSIPVRVEEPIWIFSYLWEADHTVGIVCRVEAMAPREQIRCIAGDIDEWVWVSETRMGNYLTADDHNFQAATAGFERLRSKG